MKAQLTICFAIMIFACSCRNADEVKLKDLKELVEGNKGGMSDLWLGTYYCGTKDGYHYIRHRRKYNSDIFMKIKTNELSMVETIEYTKDEGKWVSVAKLIRTYEPAIAPGVPAKTP